MVNVSFVCREQKKNRFGTAPIEMTINTNGKRTYVALELRCAPEDFKIAMKGGGNTHILEYVTACRRKIDTLIVEYTKKGLPITAESLKRGFNSVAKTYTLEDMFREYLSIARKRVGKNLSDDTYKRYEKTTELFLAANKLTADTPAGDINLSHLIVYQTELLSKLDKGTARNYLQKIKAMFKFAFETGKISSNPGYGMKIPNCEKDTVLYLTPEELERIRNHQFGKRLQEIADCFLFSCYTGLSFSDVAELEPADFIKEKGFTYINKRRKKTGIKFMAVLFEEALGIAEKYNFRLPMKTNQKTNEYLKEIADICEIEKSLHFHMARHTAACYYINHRPALPDETIQAIFGWTNPKQLRHYAKLFNTTVLEDIERSFGTKTPSMEPKTKGMPSLPDDDLEAFQKLLGI